MKQIEQLKPVKVGRAYYEGFCGIVKKPEGDYISSLVYVDERRIVNYTLINKENAEQYGQNQLNPEREKQLEKLIFDDLAKKFPSWLDLYVEWLCFMDELNKRYLWWQ